MMNTTALNASTSSEAHIPVVFAKEIDVFLKILYVIVTLFGITGNCLVIFFVAFKKVSRTAFNILLTNLSVADLIANISLYPYVFIDLKGFDISKSTGTVLCNFTIGLQLFFVCASVSLLTLTIISINRFICINHPLKFAWQQGKTGNQIMVFASWVLAIIIISPNFVSFVYVKDWGICRRIWPSGMNGQLYSLLTAFLGLIVPAAVLIYTFLATVKNLRTKIQDVQSANTMRQRTRKKTVYLLGWLIVVFCGSWSPFFVYWILSRSVNVFADGNIGDYQRMRAIRCTILIATLNTTADPFLYGLFSEQFRKALRTLLCKDKVAGSTNSVTAGTSLSVFQRTGTQKTAELSNFCIRTIDPELTEIRNSKSMTTPSPKMGWQRVRNFQVSTPSPVHSKMLLYQAA